jgi:membrane protease YdiL (CAAX protease family)
MRSSLMGRASVLVQSLSEGKSSLALPLLFSFLVISAAVVGRFVLDRHALPMAPAADGTAGQLLWIVAPLLLAWLARRLDPVTRDVAFFKLTFSVARWSALSVMLTLFALMVLLYASVYFQMMNFMLEPLALRTYVVTIASIALFAWMEEVAWRGYLLPALLPRIRYPVALMFGAAICFCWHLPYLGQLAAVYTDEAFFTLAPRVLIGLLAMQWLCAELYLRTGSIWPAFALHATFNMVASLGFVSGVRLISDDAWLLSPSIDGGAVIVAMALCACGLWRGRIKHR